MPRIVILTHQDDRFLQIDYMLREMAKAWRGRGMEVELQAGLGPTKDADLAILHVDLTRVPPDYLAAAGKFPIVVNGKVGDISKTRFSQGMVRRGDGYDGPVIVKTDRNYGGLVESLQVLKRRGPARMLYRIRQRLPWQFRSCLVDYPIFDAPSKVPGMVWHNPDLVVERFQPERKDNFYCLRTWVFFGDRESNSISYSHSPVIKSHNVVHRESIADIPVELREYRKQMCFDFGKFDYALVGNRAVLYDVNRTPTLGASNPQVVQNMGLLADGIDFFLR